MNLQQDTGCGVQIYTSYPWTGHMEHDQCLSSTPNVLQGQPCKAAQGCLDSRPRYFPDSAAGWGFHAPSHPSSTHTHIYFPNHSQNTPILNSLPTNTIIIKSASCQTDSPGLSRSLSHTDTHTIKAARTGEQMNRSSQSTRVGRAAVELVHATPSAEEAGPPVVSNVHWSQKNSLQSIWRTNYDTVLPFRLLNRGLYPLARQHCPLVEKVCPLKREDSQAALLLFSH